MTRQNVYAYPDPDDFDAEPIHVVGHFNIDSARSFDEGLKWDGNNHISMATGSQWNHERLWLTAGGRWVQHSWSQWQGSSERWEFIDAAEAREWLIRNEHEDDVIAEATGQEVPDEKGPTYGRPAIGKRVEVVLPEDVIDAIDAAAQQKNLKRSAFLRDYLTGEFGASR